MVDQTSERRRDMRRARADTFRSLQGEAPLEHRDGGEEVAVGGVEELVAPVDRTFEGLVPAVRGDRGENREAALQFGHQLLWLEDPGSRRSQFDCEGEPVEPAHQCTELPVAPGSPRALEEEAHRRLPLQGPHREHLLALGPEDDPAGGDHLHPGTTVDERLGNLRSGRADVFAVVEHDQEGPAPDVVGERAEGIDGRCRRRSQDRLDLRGHQVGITQGRQFDQVDPIPGAVQPGPADLDGQPGLPHTRRPGERHLAVLLEEPDRRAQLLLPAHESRASGREVVGRHGPQQGAGLLCQLASIRRPRLDQQ